MLDPRLLRAFRQRLTARYSNVRLFTNSLDFLFASEYSCIHVIIINGRQIFLYLSGNKTLPN